MIRDLIREEREWREGLEVGDEVVLISTTPQGRKISETTVISASPARFRVRQGETRRDTGEEYGKRGRRFGTTFFVVKPGGPAHLEAVADNAEKERRDRERQFRSDLCDALAKRGRALDLTELADLVAALDQQEAS